ncbi:MAG: hypothetical protein ABDH18_01350 [Aquificaceae bacterium]
MTHFRASLASFRIRLNSISLSDNDGIDEISLECSFEITSGGGGNTLGSSESMLISLSFMLEFIIFKRFKALARQKPRPKPISSMDSSFEILALSSNLLGIINFESHSVITPALRL